MALWPRDNILASNVTSHLGQWQVFSIGTVAAYSAKYSTLVAYKLLELF